MKPIIPFFLIALTAGTAAAETVVPTRTIRASAIITEIDVRLSSGDVPNGFEYVEDVIGQEARNTLYAGRPILVDDIGPPALVTRNQIVAIVFDMNGLTITTEGRSLERGGVGDQVRVMNLTSRTTLSGQVRPDGSIQVKN